MKKLYRGAATAAALLIWFAGQAEAQPVTVDHVPVTADSRPFFASFIDLSEHHFQEDEYFVAGHGDVYEYGPGGQLQVKSSNVPYKTRILIRRPDNPARFNGVVLFELMNPTALFDIDFEWLYNRELLLEKGYIWVGMTIKDVAIASLHAWDPARYSSLSMPDNGLAYPIYAQIAELLRNPAHSENPLADYQVRYLLGTGYSQSADYLTTFSNEFHTASFDGYLHMGGNGAAHGLNSADGLYIDDRRLNHPSVPMIRLQSETEVAIFFFSAITTRQPDSDLFRLYEVAGGSHADMDILLRNGEVIAREYGGDILPPCGQPLSPLEMGPAHRNSLALMTRWVEDGTPPPPGLIIETDEMDLVVRDEFGNAQGGLRLPDIAVPLGTFEPGNLGILPCPVAGAYFEFDEATLHSLYPSHGSYVSKVSQAAQQLVEGRYLLADDAANYIIEAAQSGVSK